MMNPGAAPAQQSFLSRSRLALAGILFTSSVACADALDTTPPGSAGASAGGCDGLGLICDSRIGTEARGESSGGIGSAGGRWRTAC
jgi:hypothetical protein